MGSREAVCAWVGNHLGRVYVKEHILNRHGVKWPPGFFSGQKGCQCCPPPPPPPPPPPAIVAQYYYLNIPGSRCRCAFCDENGFGLNVPCSWLVEVDGITNGSASGDCPGTTGCERSNGTFILQQKGVGGGASGGGCYWESPMFTSSGLADGVSSLNNCPLCRADQSMQYWLYFSYDKFMPTISLRIVGIGPAYGVMHAEWKKTLLPGDVCDAVHSLEIFHDFDQGVLIDGNFPPVSVNGCCHGAPQFVNIVPL